MCMWASSNLLSSLLLSVILLSGIASFQPFAFAGAVEFTAQTFSSVTGEVQGPVINPSDDILVLGEDGIFGNFTAFGLLVGPSGSLGPGDCGNEAGDIFPISFTCELTQTIDEPGDYC